MQFKNICLNNKNTLRKKYILMLFLYLIFKLFQNIDCTNHAFILFFSMHLKTDCESVLKCPWIVKEWNYAYASSIVCVSITVFVVLMCKHATNALLSYHSQCQQNCNLSRPPHSLAVHLRQSPAANSYPHHRNTARRPSNRYCHLLILFLLIY